MIEAACTAVITFPVTVDTPSPAQRMRQSCWLGFLCHLLRTKLTERMRFEAGKVRTARSCCRVLSSMWRVVGGECLQSCQLLVCDSRPLSYWRGHAGRSEERCCACIGGCACRVSLHCCMVHVQVYTISVTVNFGHEPAHVKRQQRHGELSITFGCDPDAVDLLTEMALAEVQRLQVVLPIKCLHVLCGSCACGPGREPLGHHVVVWQRPCRLNDRCWLRTA